MRRTADDRCQWQAKGGRPYTEREVSANEVKREPAARCGSAFAAKVIAKNTAPSASAEWCLNSSCEGSA